MRINLRQEMKAGKLRKESQESQNRRPGPSSSSCPSFQSRSTDFGIRGSRKNAVWMMTTPDNFRRVEPAYCLLLTAHCSLARFYRIAGRLPRIQTAEQCRSVIDALSFEFEHRPGARMFVRSSTVGRDQLALRQLIELRCQRAGGN